MNWVTVRRKLYLTIQVGFIGLTIVSALYWLVPAVIDHQEVRLALECLERVIPGNDQEMRLLRLRAVDKHLGELNEERLQLAKLRHSAKQGQLSKLDEEIAESQRTLEAAGACKVQVIQFSDGDAILHSDTNIDLESNFFELNTTRRNAFLVILSLTIALAAGRRWAIWLLKD